MTLLTLDPRTGKRVRSYPLHRPTQIESALVQSERAGARWAAEKITQRIRLIKAVGAELRRQGDHLGALITLEMGKPITESKAEVAKCAGCCDYYAHYGRKFLEPETPPGAPAGASVQFDPLGTVLAIMPWNFPLWQAFRAAIPAVLAGNTVLLKHASNVTGCALAIESLFTRAGAPRGVFQTLRVGSDAIAGLLADRRVHGVTLTGSTGAGKKVAAAAGEALKPCVFELGGSDPYLVFDDADLDLAAETCAQARLVNTGQSCVAAKRFIVQKSVLAEFEEKFVARMRARRQGDPTDPATELGPMAREDLRDELHRQVTRSVRAGARLLTGGQLPKGMGYYYPATVLTGVKPGMPAYDDELFGPAAAIISVRDEVLALKVANDSPFGLGSAVFTRSPARARRIVNGLQSGTVAVNEPVRSDVALPFGGVKESGYGRELGAWGARSFVNVKTVRWSH
ncbi:MAG TPA: NAD-dependent succinate-semialdehyde dehydrogenase [Opitutaceae bacterium]|nr:NAD-dependent succinate-semialdehyde dehydrogenase [Opitutaceae bacterium]